MFAPMKILNYTNRDIVLLIDKQPLKIPQTGVVRFRTERDTVDYVEHDGFDIPINQVTFTPPEGIPEPKEGTIIIAPNLIASMLSDRDDIYVLDKPVKTPNKVTVGYSAIAKFVKFQ